MSCDTVVCDWNGTITRDRDERPILETIALDVFKTSIPFHPLRAARLLRARVELEKLYRQGRRDHEFDFIIEMFAIYNRKIIRGLPLSFIHRSVERYASRQDTQHKLDLRVLRPLRDCHSEGKTTGILSAGYGHGIDRILTVAGFRNCFDFREADSFRHEGGRATEFLLSIYRNKPRLLLNTLRSRNLDEDRTAYIGDSEDDEGCFQIARYPIVSFMATDELKQRCAVRYNAFVPQHERDLASYLGKM